METTIKSAGYIRVSSKEQVEGESLNTQTQAIRKFAESQGYQLTEIYSDAGITGSSIKKRVAFQKLLRDAEAGKFQVLIIYRLSRFSRNALDLLNSVKKLKDFNVSLKSISEGIDFSSKYGEAILGMLGVIAQLEKDILTEQMFENKVVRAKRGVPTSGSYPYGRIYDKKTETWSLDEAKAGIIKTVAERYINGESLQELAKISNMSYSNLYFILKNTAGDKWTVNFNNDVITYNIPALLSDETINKVRDRIDFNRTSNRSDVWGEYLLSGFVRCESCGYSLTGQTYKPNATRSKDYKYYKHRHEQFTKSNCKAFKTIPADVIEFAVMRTIFENIHDVPSFEKAIAESLPDKSMINDLNKQIKASEKELSKVNKEIEKLVDMALSGILSKDTIKNKEAELIEQREKISEMISDNYDRLNNLPDPKVLRSEAERVRINLLEKYSGKDRLTEMTFDEKRKLLHFLFDGKDDKGKPYGIYITKHNKSHKSPIDYFLYGKLVGVRTVKGNDIDYTGHIDAEIAENTGKVNNSTTKTVAFERLKT